jgi:hypothetical protein
MPEDERNQGGRTNNTVGRTVKDSKTVPFLICPDFKNHSNLYIVQI